MMLNLEEGRKVLGSFYPNLDPINLDGTYKRSIYYQIRTAFYNKYYNPSKIWGLENIDFELSKTKRILTDQFLLMGIPRKIFGDKIIPNSITIHDNSLDNPYTITDDGNGNLFAGINLFSHQQEVGEYKNGFIAEKSSSYCDFYFGGLPNPPINLIVTSGSSILNWTNNDVSVDGFVVEKSTDGINYNQYITTSLTTIIDTQVSSSYVGSEYWYRVFSFNSNGTSSYSNTASIVFTIPIVGPDWNNFQWMNLCSVYGNQTASGGNWVGQVNAPSIPGFLAYVGVIASMSYSGPNASASIAYYTTGSISQVALELYINGIQILPPGFVTINQTYDFYIPGGQILR